MITQAYLKKILEYEEATGFFTWKGSRGHIEKGTRAGAYDNSNGYIQLMIDKKNYYAHKLAWIYIYGSLAKGLVVDYINRDQTDNRLCNLRAVSHGENRYNSRMRSDNTSGITGVCLDKRKNTWLARLNINKKQLVLGHYSSLLDAAKARYDSEIKYGVNIFNKKSSAYKYLLENGALNE